MLQLPELGNSFLLSCSAVAFVCFSSKLQHAFNLNRHQFCPPSTSNMYCKDNRAGKKGTWLTKWACDSTGERRGNWRKRLSRERTPRSKATNGKSGQWIEVLYSATWGGFPRERLGSRINEISPRMVFFPAQIQAWWLPIKKQSLYNF